MSVKGTILNGDEDRLSYHVSAYVHDSMSMEDLEIFAQVRPFLFQVLFFQAIILILCFLLRNKQFCTGYSFNLDSQWRGIFLLHCNSSLLCLYSGVFYNLKCHFLHK